MDPTYLLTQLPGDSQESFLILQPFVPVSPSDKQQNLTAFMTAKSDPSDYGTLQVFTTTSGQQVDGPALINATINQNTEISGEITLLNQQGSQVNLGNVITVPIGQALLYVQPLYVGAKSNPVPRLGDVIIVYNGQAYHGPNLNAALCKLPFGQSFCNAPGAGQAPITAGTATPGTPTTGGTTPTTAPAANQTVQQLLASASKHFQNADTALKNGDLAGYQKENQLGVADVNRAAQQSGTPPPSTTPPSSAP
jgi:uncharacterized membrane protein (UPF0182 family)